MTLIGRHKKLLSISVLLFCGVFKSIVILYLGATLKSEVFSQFINVFNCIVVAGFIFSLEHHVVLNRRIFSRTFRSKRISYWEYYRKVLGAGHILKAVIGTCIISYLFSLELLEAVVLTAVVSSSLYVVDRQRFLLAAGFWFASAMTNAYHLFAVSIAALSVALFDSGILGFLLVVVAMNVSYCALTRIGYFESFLSLNRRLLARLIGLTRVAGPYVGVSILGFLAPLVDKFVFFQLELHDLVKEVVIVGVIAGFGTLACIQVVNNPWQNKIISGISSGQMNQLLQKSLFWTFLTSVSLISFFGVVYPALSTYLEFLHQFEMLGIVEIGLIVLTLSLLPTTGLLSMLLYAKHADKEILKIAFTEFIIKLILLYCFFSGDLMIGFGLLLVHQLAFIVWRYQIAKSFY